MVFSKPLRQGADGIWKCLKWFISPTKMNEISLMRIHECHESLAGNEVLILECSSSGVRYLLHYNKYDLYLVSYSILCHCGNFPNDTSYQYILQILSSQLTFSTSFFWDILHLNIFVIEYCHWWSGFGCDLTSFSRC